jgi:hypothetical protein
VQDHLKNLLFSLLVLLPDSDDLHHHYADLNFKHANELMQKPNNKLNTPSIHTSALGGNLYPISGF